jgi:hypothetical protein
MTIKHGSNIHEIRIKGNEGKVALLSDLHWDNPKCDRALLKKHLDYCLANNIPVHINGDMFCLMQGRGDRRGNKSDILPEHNNARYLDSVIETAVEWFSPYKDVLTVIGYGNHETSIIKHQDSVSCTIIQSWNVCYCLVICSGCYLCCYTIRISKFNYPIEADIIIIYYAGSINCPCKYYLSIQS